MEDRAMREVERFRGMVESLKETSRRQRDHELKVLRLQGVVIGWMVVHSEEVSETMRRGNGLLRLAARVTIILLAFLHIALAVNAHRSSDRQMGALSKFSPVAPDYYAGYALTETKVVLGLMASLLLFGVLFALVGVEA